LVNGGIRDLMAEIILVAFEDYQAFQRHGLIVRGRVAPNVKVRVKGARITDVGSAVWFFWDGGLEVVAELGGLEMDWDAVREKLEPEEWHELKAERKARRIGSRGRLEGGRV